MYKKGTGNDKQGKDAGNRKLCPYRNFSRAIKVNKSGRTYHKGKPLSLRQNVIDKIMQGKRYADVSKDLGIAKSSVTNNVKQ